MGYAAEREVAAFKAPLPWQLKRFEPGRQALVYNVRQPGARPTGVVPNAFYRVVRRDYHWVEKPGQGPSLALDQEQSLSPDAAIHLHDITPDGKLWLLHRTHQAWVVWPEGRVEGERILADKPGFGETGVTLSSDGRWLAGQKDRRGVHIWDVTSQRWATNLPSSGPCHMVFTPNGRWLLLGAAQEYQAWEVGTWRRMASWPANLTSAQGYVSPSPDSKLAALVRDDRLQLISLSTWQEVVTLKLPSEIYVERAAWSPDGRRLYVLGARQRLFVWNLPELRKELAALGLDWKDAADAISKR